jgi:hypothetical protein
MVQPLWKPSGTFSKFKNKVSTGTKTQLDRRNNFSVLQHSGMAIVHNNLLHILQRSEEKSTKDPDIKE